MFQCVPLCHVLWTRLHISINAFSYALLIFILSTLLCVELLLKCVCICWCVLNCVCCANWTPPAIQPFARSVKNSAHQYTWGQITSLLTCDTSFPVYQLNTLSINMMKNCHLATAICLQCGCYSNELGPIPSFLHVHIVLSRQSSQFWLVTFLMRQVLKDFPQDCRRNEIMSWGRAIRKIRGARLM